MRKTKELDDLILYSGIGDGKFKDSPSINFIKLFDPEIKEKENKERDKKHRSKTIRKEPLEVIGDLNILPNKKIIYSIKRCYTFDHKIGCELILLDPFKSKKDSDFQKILLRSPNQFHSAVPYGDKILIAKENEKYFLVDEDRDRIRKESDKKRRKKAALTLLDPETKEEKIIMTLDDLISPFNNITSILDFRLYPYKNKIFSIRKHGNSQEIEYCYEKKNILTLIDPETKEERLISSPITPKYCSILPFDDERFIYFPLGGDFPLERRNISLWNWKNGTEEKNLKIKLGEEAKRIESPKLSLKKDKIFYYEKSENYSRLNDNECRINYSVLKSLKIKTGKIQTYGKVYGYEEITGLVPVNRENFNQLLNEK